MQPQTDPLEDFHARVSHHLQYWNSLEFACLALHVGSEWVQFAGRATLSTEQCQPKAQISRVVDLPDFRAYAGRLPAKTLETLISNLRSSLLIQAEEDVRLVPPGSPPYSWTNPSPRRTNAATRSTNRWPNVLTTVGSASNLNNLFWQNLPGDIDKRLRYHRPPYNGLTALDATLGLEFERYRNGPHFDLGAEIPARFLSSEVDREHRRLTLQMEYGGLPELLIEWLPQRRAEVVAIPDSRVPGPETYGVSVTIPQDATEAEARLLALDEDADELTQRVGCDNVLLRVCEFLDQGQTHLSDLLYTESNLKNANAFELGVARLLGLAGYTVLWFGKAAKEALPDLVAYAKTARGAEFLIYIECTLKNPNEKLSDLSSRATELRSFLGPRGKDLLAVVFVRNQVTEQDRQTAFGMGLRLCAGDDIRELQQVIKSDATPREVFDRLRFVSPYTAIAGYPFG